METTIPDSIFEEVAASNANTETLQSTVVPAGYYTVKVISDTVRVRVSGKTGNRYLQIPMVAIENAEGEKVASKVINKIVMFEGTNSKGASNMHSFVQTFTAFGYDKDDIKGLYESLLADLPDNAAIQAAQYGSVDIALTFGEGGEPAPLKGATLKASIKETTYNDEPRNEISSVWAI